MSLAGIFAVRLGKNMQVAIQHKPTLSLPQTLLVGMLCVMFFLASTVGKVSAQAPEPTVQLTGEDNRNFPEIQVDFKGQNLPPLQALSSENVTVIEEGERITPDEVEALYSGIHFSLVINPEYSLTLRGVNGLQYYAEMINAVKTIGPDLDHPDQNRYSLHINPDLSTIEVANYDAWVNAIDAYQENQRNLIASLDSLSLAIAALEISESQLETVLLYITPYLHPTILPGFFSLIERAAAIGVPVHTWIVMDRRMLGSAYETNLQEALETGGGSLTSFTGLEEVPDPKSYLEGKGNSHHLTYQSLVRESGMYNLEVEIKLPEGETLRSSSRQLDLMVEPASLSFVNAPDRLELIRDEEGNVSPSTLPIEVLIDFPDGFARSIIRSTLFVNGDRSQTNQEPPYGSFVIDLNQIDELDELTLEVRLEDELGLQGKTPPKTIILDVFQPESPYSDAWYAKPWLWLGLVAVAALIALLIFRKPGKKPESTKPDSKSSESKEELPEQALASPTFVTIKSFGSLMKLDPDQTPSAEKPHLLVKEITLIGRDASLANLVLDEPSLEPLHAEIHFFPDGRIRLTDFNTTSGTYVNFKPVTAHGTSLQHADLVHFGSLLFRFNSSTRTQSGSSETGTIKSDKTE